MREGEGRGGETERERERERESRREWKRECVCRGEEERQTESRREREKERKKEREIERERVVERERERFQSAALEPLDNTSITISLSDATTNPSSPGLYPKSGQPKPAKLSTPVIPATPGSASSNRVRGVRWSERRKTLLWIPSITSGRARERARARAIERERERESI